MGIFSAIKRQQCIREYQKELAAQNYSFEQWRAAQPAFHMSEEYAHAAILYADYVRQEPATDEVQEPVFLPDFSPNRWDYEDYLGEAVFIREDLYGTVDWEHTSRRAGLKQIIESVKKQSTSGEYAQNGAKCAKTAYCTEAAECTGTAYRTEPVYCSKPAGCEAVIHVRGLLTEAPTGFVKLNKRPGIGFFETSGEETVAETKQEGISVIIPSKDHPDILQKCLESLEKTTGDIPLEVILVDNGSCKQNKAMVNFLCQKMTQATDGRINCRYIYEPMDFHFSEMCNMGAARAKGAYLVFLNDDIEAVEVGWLTDMLAESMKPYTGAVGMKLLYPDGKRIQHAGIVNLPMGPVHKLQFAADDEIYYDRRNRGVHNVSAVTGACLMIRKDLFEKLGGMSLELPVAFNDVELCFKAMEQGYYNVICCNKFLLHHESISRGQDNTEEKRSRLLRERSKLYEMHPGQVSSDPFYPYDAKTGYGLCHAFLDTAIWPAYEDGLPLVQEIEGGEQSTGESMQKVLLSKKEKLEKQTGRLTETAGCSGQTGYLKEIERTKERQAFPQKPEHVKLNPCLKVEVEQLYQETPEDIHVAGYSFVVGSDNSQFTYTLILRGEEKSYAVPLRAMRRNDLERNMPDQVNVGLAGFHVKLPVKQITAGRYRVEVYAKDRTSGLRLRQSSNVIMQIN